MEKIILNISGMHCASCASNIEGALKRLPGVFSARVNFATEKAYLEFEPQKLKPADLITTVKKSGYQAFLPGVSPDREKEIRDREVRGLKRKFILSITLSTLLMYIAMGPCVGLGVHKAIMDNMALIQFLLASGVLICGYQFFARGFLTLVRIHRANMDTLVALGVGSAYLYSLFVSINIWLGNKSLGMSNLYYEVAAFLLTFVLLGKYLEALTKRKTSQSIKRLWNLRPKTAIVMRQGQEVEIPVEELLVGDMVVVKPGQRIPVDGKITEGYSSVDESMITGESIPVEKALNDKVIGGSINKYGTFKFKATKVGKDTTLAQIIKLVEEAQGSKAPIQELADKVAAIFVPTVLIIAFASFFIWILLGKGFVFALTTFIAVLIIACPCSLGLATPTAVMVGTGKAAENGIIIKNAASLQIAAEIDKIIFDKTGTLTEGKPKLTDIVSYIGNEDEVLMLAASLEKPSGHVLSDALVEAAKEKGIFLKPMQQFETISGKGVVGKIEEGQTILAGNRRLMQERAIDLKIAAGDLDRLEEQGKTIILVAKEDKLMGLVAVRDTVKKLSRTLIAKLKGMGKDVIMITGDNKRTALAIAKEIGIQKVLAEVLPKDKLGEIKKLQNDGFKVAFVGDGINDAPALSGADLGIAIGSGTDIAIESGDIILIKDDLADVATAIELSGYAMRKIKQNLFWAFFYNMIGIPIAAGILYPFNGLLLNPMVAGAAMAFSSVSVVLNSLLMNSYKPSV
ncbi:MAG: heavy metal translocating P-type ATPase [Candidatus Omnitrophica bacterium]|nr:heavy metal translocating P-type ATPase [Candidatus Omnitrophota bacterium]MBU4303215.1 heavy metal translocating P-type ATPase [Candidatus Omnitrophota bacterium]MCG2707464.1 heavy metal translocating P-type ATPase [Candidatus Omnitrophota bacterium]